MHTYIHSWYNPDIGRSEEIIAQCKPIRIIETVKERTQRMHSSDKMARDLKLAKKTEEVYADVTFQPKLDRVSAALGRSKIRIMIEGSFLYNVGILFHVECCIRQLRCSSIISCNITSIVYNHPAY